MEADFDPLFCDALSSEVFGVFCLIVFFGALIAGYIYKRGLPGGHLLGLDAVPAHVVKVFIQILHDPKDVPPVSA